MNDLRELYQQVILDHNRNPRNFKELPKATKKVEGYNPLCGDRVNIETDILARTVVTTLERWRNSSPPSQAGREFSPPSQGGAGGGRNYREAELTLESLHENGWAAR